MEKVNAREHRESGCGPVLDSWVPTTARAPRATMLLESEQVRHGRGLCGICSSGARDMNQITAGTHRDCKQPGSRGKGRR